MNQTHGSNALTVPTQRDWTIEESRIHQGYHASLGDVHAHADTYQRAAQSLFEKLDLLKQRLLSLGRSPLLKPNEALRGPKRLIQ